jgi:hypothetical protein
VFRALQTGVDVGVSQRRFNFRHLCRLFQVFQLLPMRLFRLTIIQGITMCDVVTLSSQVALVKLWVHEISRVFRDGLIDDVIHVFLNAVNRL